MSAINLGHCIWADAVAAARRSRASQCRTATCLCWIPHTRLSLPSSPHCALHEQIPGLTSSSCPLSLALRTQPCPVTLPASLQPPHLQLVLDPALIPSLTGTQTRCAPSALEKHPEATPPLQGTLLDSTDMGRTCSPCNPPTLSPVCFSSFLPFPLKLSISIPFFPLLLTSRAILKGK